MQALQGIQNSLPMQFYLHREGVQFSSRGNFNGIGMGKNQISYPFVIGRKKIKSRV